MILDIPVDISDILEVSEINSRSGEEDIMLNDIQEALLKGKKDEVEKLVDQALASGQSAAAILNEGLIVGMDRLGVMFKNNEVFIPEVLVAARAMNAGMAKLEPLLVKEGIQPKGTVVIGTVKGDLHDIGKNIVAMMLKGAGYRIVDLGIDASADQFVAAAKASQANVMALSALLTTTMIGMKAIVQAVEASGLKIHVIIGGAPVTRDYANEIKAEGYAADAASAVEEVARLLAR
jgi:5-methyltetrahydrofolate--homocysteine methyltransferase